MELRGERQSTVKKAGRARNHIPPYLAATPATDRNCSLPTVASGIELAGKRPHSQPPTQWEKTHEMEPVLPMPTPSQRFFTRFRAKFTAKVGEKTEFARAAA